MGTRTNGRRWARGVAVLLVATLAACGREGGAGGEGKGLSQVQRAALVNLARAIEQAVDGGVDPERALPAADVVTFQDMPRGYAILSDARSACLTLSMGDSDARVATARDMLQTAKDIRIVGSWKRAGIVNALIRGDVAAFEAAVADLSETRKKGWPVDSVPLELRR